MPCIVLGAVLEDCCELNRKMDLHDPDNHDGVITDLKPDILECDRQVGLRKDHYQES